METLRFLISLAGAVMLLLYAVRMVQTGIDRAFGASFRALMTRNRTPAGAFIIGIILAVVVQSSAAVALLVSQFAASGALAFSLGLAAVLGADLGSAIVVKILSFRLDWLTPLLFAGGGLLFLKASGKIVIQVGRITLGLGFILLSLRLLRETMEPIRESAFLPAIAAQLEADPITGFLVGVALALLMHSSVAAILMAVTFVAIGVLPFFACIPLVLGANLGSALIPLWLTRGKTPAARRIPLANLILRGGVAIVALGALEIPVLRTLAGGAQDAAQLVLLHLMFNAILVIWVPFGKWAEAWSMRLLPDKKRLGGLGESVFTRSALADELLNDPEQAVTCLRREVLRMGQLTEMAMRPVMQHFEAGDQEAIAELAKIDRKINACLSGIRLFVIKLGERPLGDKLRAEVGSLTEYAINLESAGDVVAKRLLPLAAKKARRRIRFSGDGWRELLDLHDRVTVNTSLALNVLVTENIEAARRLVEEKSDLANRERASRLQHLKRIQRGMEASLESSDLHLETLRALKNFNSQICSVAYPILHREGQLLDSRLVTSANSP